jgi:hypothetical protein
MEQNSVTPEQQYPSSPPPSSPKISKKMVLLAGVVFLIFVFFLFSMILTMQSSKRKVSPLKGVPTSSSVVSPTARRWQILLSYNPSQQDLQLKSIAIEKGEAAPLSVSSSSYILRVFDKAQKKIYETPVSISEAVMYDLYVPPTGGKNVVMPTQPRSLDTSVTVPYLSSADSIKIVKNNTVILEFAPPKDNNISFIQPVYADTPACKALTVIFVSDGYTDKSKFEADAAKIQSTLTSVSPYNTEANKAIFSFKTVWNTVPLGCTASGVLDSSCVIRTETQSAVRSAAGVAAETAFNKYIIVTDATPQVLGTVPANGDTSGLPKILGATSAAGGDYVVTQSREYAATSTVHEIGGHAIGQLYDRYVDDQDYNRLSLGPHSNCSDSPTVHDGWSGSSYKGCTKSSWYAPAPTADPAQYPACGGGGALLSGGSPDTVMSAAGCFSAATPKFDAAETTWISTLLKNNYESYQACVDRSKTTTDATPTSVSAASTAGVTSLPPMATTIDQCPAKPAAGSPGTLEPGTRNLSYNDNNDPEILFGHYIDSINRNDLYFTAGQANVEARWAGSKTRNPANGEYRGMYYVRAGRPGGFERAGGYVYDPAYDWATPYGEGHYGESGWSHAMGRTGEAEKGSLGLTKDRNCILATQIQRLIAEKTSDSGNNSYYTGSRMWYRVATRPTSPASEANSVIKIHATGAGINGGWYPTMALYIDQYKVKTWKNFGKNPKPGDIYTYPDPNDPADANVRIGKVEPHRVIVGIDDSRFDDESGTGKVNSMVLYGINIDGTDYSSVASTTFHATTYVDKLQSCVAIPGKEFDHSATGGWFWCGYFWFDYANALKDPYTSPTLFKDISADGSKGTGTVAGDDPNGNGTTAKPKQQYYTCSVDPSCKSGKLGVQLCALKCVPK